MVYKEIVTERIGEHILASYLVPATEEDICSAMQQNPCLHELVQDEKGWLYDFRSCFTCGHGLGAI